MPTDHFEEWTDLAQQADQLEPGPERTALFEQMFALYQADPRAVTAGGLPYPVPTDPVMQGADAIRALAQAVDIKVPAVKTAAFKGFISTDASGLSLWDAPITLNTVQLQLETNDGVAKVLQILQITGVRVIWDVRRTTDGNRLGSSGYITHIHATGT